MKQRKIISIGLLIIILGITVLIHELGHFAFAKIFHIPAPIFSIGFGPALAAFKIGGTEFRLSILPLGGYVSLDEKVLDASSYFTKIIITLAGIFNNILLAFIIFAILWYIHRNQSNIRQKLSGIVKNRSQFLRLLMQSGNTIELTTFLHSRMELILVFIALVNLDIAFFNILPIPFLDGGHLVRYTVEEIVHRLSLPYPAAIIHLTQMILLIALILYINKRSARLTR